MFRSAGGPGYAVKRRTACRSAGVCAFSLALSMAWHGVTWFRRRTLRQPAWCGLSRVSCVKMF